MLRVYAVCVVYDYNYLLLIIARRRRTLLSVVWWNLEIDHDKEFVIKHVINEGTSRKDYLFY